MPRTLSIKRKLLSLTERMQILDKDERVVYEAAWKFSWLNQTWVLSRDGREVARIKRKLLSWLPSYYVQTGSSQFMLRNRWAWRRKVQVQGGPYDGAELRGSLFDMSFELRHTERLLARADAKVLTLRERHVIELLDDSAEAELLTAILMVNLLVQKSEDASTSSSAASSG